MTTGGAPACVPFRTAKMFPIASTRVSSPDSRAHATKRSRPSRSMSVSASRFTPPFGVAPIRARSISERHKRSPFTRRESMGGRGKLTPTALHFARRGRNHAGGKATQAQRRDHARPRRPDARRLQRPGRAARRLCKPRCLRQGLAKPREVPAGEGRPVCVELLLRPGIFRPEPDRWASAAQPERDGCGPRQLGKRLLIVTLVVQFRLQLELVVDLAYVKQQLERHFARRLRVDGSLAFFCEQQQLARPRMRRENQVPRADWRKRCEDAGFFYHSVGGTYWDETACYAFSSEQVDRLEEVTAELHKMCLDAAEEVVRAGRFAEFAIPAQYHEMVADSWRRGEPSLYGRFDFIWDGEGT